MEEQFQSIDLSISERLYNLWRETPPDKWVYSRNKLFHYSFLSQKQILVRFNSLSSLLTISEMSPRQFADLSGYNYKSILSWVAGATVPDSLRNSLLTVKMEASYIGVYFQLQGFKHTLIGYNYKLSRITPAGRIAKKPKIVSKYLRDFHTAYNASNGGYFQNEQLHRAINNELCLAP